MNFIFPVKTYLTVTQGFHSGHVGHDYGWTSKVKDATNQEIIAAESGTVLTAVDGYGNTYPSNRIYGNYVVIAHSGGYFTLYGHLLKGSVCVKVGQKVSKGETVGRMGNTGYSCGTHLHFEVRSNGINSKASAIDPFKVCRLEGNVVVSSTTLYPEKIKRRGVGTPVERDKYKYQIEVLIDNLNARTFASINADRLGYATKGVFNVLSGPQKAGDYDFYEIEKNVWIAYSPMWANVYKPITSLSNIKISNVSAGDVRSIEELCKKLELNYVIESSIN